jgi:energy-coupling factor transporter transmembrane protein EcfT
MKDKSVGAALVLTFLFGPLGLLYSSVIGGLLLIVVGGVVFVATLGLAGLIIWPLSMVWGAVAASNQHSKYQAWLAQMRQMPAGPAAPPVPPRP